MIIYKYTVLTPCQISVFGVNQAIYLRSAVDK